MAQLRLSNLVKTFGQQNVVNQLNLEIEAGAFAALLGPSGSGKSTVLRMLAGFETPSQGSIYHGGQCLSDTHTVVPPEQRNFGMVFQSYALWPHMSVEENIGYPLVIKGVKAAEKRQKVKQAMEIVQLAPYANRQPASLSGGQRQRVALARSLVTEPQVVLLDEPLANLDRHLRATMEETFRLFHQRTGATMIYVTHDQGEAMSLADKIAVLKEGQVLQWSDPSTLYREPINAWVAQFIGRGSILSLTGVPVGKKIPAGQIQQQISEQEIAGKMPAGPATVPVLVRPESLRLAPDAGVTSRVINCVYRGERYDIELQLACGQVLLAYYQQPLAVGAQIGVSFTEGWSLEQMQ